MYKWVRDYIRDRFFASEKIEYEAKSLALKQMKESANIVALAREQLAGFDSKLLNSTLSLHEQFESEDALNTFLDNVKGLHDNPALKIIIDYLTREQILYGQMNAESLLALNFSRATVNGLTLFMEEVDNSLSVYLKKHEPEEEFDENAVV